MRKQWGWLLLAAALVAAPAAAEPKLTLTSMTPREEIAVTVYNPAVSLVQEQRVLSLNKGMNEFRVSWGGVRVYRSSVRLEVPEAARVTVRDAIMLQTDPSTVIWHLEAAQAGTVPVRLLYYVEGFSWEASHVLTLDAAEKELSIRSYAAVGNYTGENYQQAALRLALGEVRLLSPSERGGMVKGEMGPAGPAAAPPAVAYDAAQAKTQPSFEREGFAEYTFFDLKRREDLDSGDTKRILLAASKPIPARRVYLFDPKLYNGRVAMQYWFENKPEYGLGAIAPGLLRAFRLEEGGREALLGEDRLAYLPVGETAKIHLGTAQNVIVEPAQVSLQQTDEEWDKDHEELLSYVELVSYRVTVKNRKDGPVEVVLRQYIPADATLTAQSPEAKRLNSETLEWTLKLGAGATTDVTYATSRKVREG